jgi:hypothetical protein
LSGVALAACVLERVLAPPQSMLAPSRRRHRRIRLPRVVWAWISWRFHRFPVTRLALVGGAALQPAHGQGRSSWRLWSAALSVQCAGDRRPLAPRDQLRYQTIERFAGTPRCDQYQPYGVRHFGGARPEGI